MYGRLLWKLTLANGIKHTHTHTHTHIHTHTHTHSVVSGDYTLCMQHLMRFPNVYEVNYLVQRALHIRSPVRHHLSISPHTHILALVSYIYTHTHTCTVLYPHTLIPSLTHTIIPSLTHAIIPSLTHTIIPSRSLTHTIIPSLTHTIIPWLTHTIIPHSLTPSYFTHSSHHLIHIAKNNDTLCTVMALFVCTNVSVFCFFYTETQEAKIPNSK